MASWSSGKKGGAVWKIMRGKKVLAEAESLRGARGAARCLIVEDGVQGPLTIWPPNADYALETASIIDGRYHLATTDLSRRYL